jgi:hypothetical protein
MKSVRSICVYKSTSYYLLTVINGNPRWDLIFRR